MNFSNREITYEEIETLLLMSQGELEFDAFTYDELYDLLLNSLRVRELKVEFVKQDGSLRVMYCTRSKRYIDENYGSSRKKTNTEEITIRDKSNRLVKVFDTEKNAFRSFKLERVNYIEFLNEI